MASEPLLRSTLPSSASARDAGYLIGGQLLASGLLLATGIVLARALGPSGKGYYDIAVGSALLLSTFTGLSLSSGIFFYASKGPLPYRRLLLMLGGIALGQGVVVTGVLASLGDTRLLSWMLPGGSRWTAAVLIGGLLVALQSQQFVQGLVKGRGEFRTFARSEILARAGALATAVVLFAVGITRSEAYVAGFGLATLAAVLLLTSGLMTAPLGTGRPHLLRAMLLYSLPLFLGNVVQFLNYRIDIFVLKNYAGLSAVGTYMVAVWLAQIVWLVPNALASLVLRAVAEREGAGVIERVATVTRGSFALSLVMGLGLAAVGSLSIAPVFGHQFRSSVPALLLLTPGTILFCPTIVLSAYLNGIQRQATTTWVACGALVVTLALNLLLVPQMGILGAAIASTCSYAASTVATVYVVRRLNPGLPVAALLLARRSDLQIALGAMRAGAAWVRTTPWRHDRNRRSS